MGVMHPAHSIRINTESIPYPGMNNHTAYRTPFPRPFSCRTCEADTALPAIYQLKTVLVVQYHLALEASSSTQAAESHYLTYSSPSSIRCTSARVEYFAVVDSATRYLENR